jgi:hypothetical protein
MRRGERGEFDAYKAFQAELFFRSCLRIARPERARAMRLAPRVAEPQCAQRGRPGNVARRIRGRANARPFAWQIAQWKESGLGPISVMLCVFSSQNYEYPLTFDAAAFLKVQIITPAECLLHAPPIRTKPDSRKIPGPAVKSSQPQSRSRTASACPIQCRWKARRATSPGRRPARSS